MTQRFFVLPDNTYWGSFEGAVKDKAVPAGATEVPSAPADARQLWDPVAAKWLPLPLAELRSAAKAEVDRQAENVRQHFLTPGHGQFLVYQAKRQEADSWAASLPNPVLADFPFMRARASRLNAVEEADVTQVQMQAVADEWGAKIATWITAGIAIETEREGAKEAIDAAADPAAIDAVVAGLAWPSPAA